MKRGPKPSPPRTTPSADTRSLVPPNRLRPAERRTWDELVEQWEPLNVLTPADAPLLEVIVRTWRTWQEAERTLTEHGPTYTTDTGYVGQRPEVAISLKNRQLLRQLLNEIGATPSSRSSLNLPPVKTTPSKLELFLAHKQPASVPD